jgi:endo-1,4-beta-xylanase
VKRVTAITKRKRTVTPFKKYRWVIAGFATAVLIAMLLLSYVGTSNTTYRDTSVYAPQNIATMWTTFPGASQKGTNSVHFASVNRKIVKQDGSGGAPDQAVNVGGPHLTQTGNFKLSLNIGDLNGSVASFRLYRDVPVIYDEWRYDGNSVGITFEGQKLMVQMYNGKSENAASTKSYNLDGSSNSVVSKLKFWQRHTMVASAVSNTNAHTVVFERQGDNLIIAVDSNKITTLSAKTLFDGPSGNLWFGVDAANTGWTLNALNLSGAVRLQNPLDTDRTNTADNHAVLLGVQATAIRPTLKIGAAISLYPLMSDLSYRNLALNQFTIWTPENSMKAQFIHPMQGVYSFEQSDLLVNTASKNGIAVHGHALIFGEANPAWMQTTPTGNLKAVMEDHITKIMQHYTGKVSEWDVVNEPLADYDKPTGTNGLRLSIWYKAMGESFIADALTTAHSADPNAKLYINEFGLEDNGDRWDTFLNLVKNLKKNNIPLDGVGFQSHVYETKDDINATILKNHIEQLAELGVVSRISEMDVHGEDATFQAQQFKAILSACRMEVTCTSFSTWGISDKYGSTTSDHTYPPEYGNDLVWDSNFQPKAAFTALLSALK